MTVIIIKMIELPWRLRGSRFPPAMQETGGSIPGLGRSGEGNGNRLQYSCLKNPKDRRALASPPIGSQSPTWLSNLTLTFPSSRWLCMIVILPPSLAHAGFEIYWHSVLLFVVLALPGKQRSSNRSAGDNRWRESERDGMGGFGGGGCCSTPRGPTRVINQG